MHAAGSSDDGAPFASGSGEGDADSVPERPQQGRRRRADQRDLGMLRASGLRHESQDEPREIGGLVAAQEHAGDVAQPHTARRPSDHREMRCRMRSRDEAQGCIGDGAGGDENQRVVGDLLERAAIGRRTGRAERKAPDHADVQRLRGDGARHGPGDG